jgi:hypothetical protein
MSFYLFSSLVQADAAIIGFGIVFIVYKLQSIENRSQTSLQLLRTLGHFDMTIAPLVKQIIENDVPVFKGSALRQYLNHPYYKELELLVTIPLRAERIKTAAFDTIRYTSVHMLISACCIVVVPILGDQLSNVPLIIVSLIILIYFGLVIRKVEDTARNVVSSPNEFDLGVLSPEIYKEAHS